MTAAPLRDTGKEPSLQPVTDPWLREVHLDYPFPPSLGRTGKSLQVRPEPHKGGWVVAAPEKQHRL